MADDYIPLNTIFDERGDVRQLSDIMDACMVLALRRYRGNLSVVSAATGLSRATLYRRLSRRGLDPEDFRNRRV